MKVTLLTHTPNPEQIVASAARLCYSPSTIDDITKSQTPEKATTFIAKLFALGHESPFEHAVFTFGIEGVSRALTHQLVRHRMASYSQQSQRYVDGGNFDIIIPDSVKSDENALAEFQNAIGEAQNAYKKLSELGVPKEDARFVLPNASDTRIIMTINARSLFNFFKHRCCTRAQWEIKALADEMLRLVKAAAPSIFEFAGPSCLKGKCPEGEMTCGKIKQVRAEYLGEAANA
jgi:thymidylate synthase, flavin-dependent